MLILHIVGYAILIGIVPNRWMTEVIAEDEACFSCCTRVSSQLRAVDVEDDRAEPIGIPDISEDQDKAYPL